MQLKTSFDWGTVNQTTPVATVWPFLFITYINDYPATIITVA
jgi:hypothetical protein